MNKLIKLSAFLLIAMMVTSCADDALGPVVTFEKATIGAYIRQVEIRTAEYDLMNLGTTAIDYSVDFVDVQDGALVNELVIEAQYFDNDPSNGDNSAARQVFKTYSKSDFTTSSRGNPGTDVVLPLSEVVALFGLNSADLSPGDAVGFFGTITLDDGSSYASTNSTATIRGSAFQGLFDVSANITCPISDALFAGSYNLAATAGATGGPWGAAGAPVLGDVTLSPIAGSSTKRRISSVGILPNFGPFVIDVDIDFVCDKVVVLGGDTGASCGGPSIALVGSFGGTDYSNPADITSDGTQDITWVEDGGGCGYAYLVEATLTKN